MLVPATRQNGIFSPWRVTGLIRTDYRVITFGERQVTQRGGNRYRRALKPEEVQKLLEHATARMRPVWLCLLNAGPRKGEVVELR